MQHPTKKATAITALFCSAVLLCCALTGCSTKNERHDASTFAMSTFITQQAYGPNAIKAMQEVNAAIATFENQLSLFDGDSDIGRINAAAGSAEGAEVSPATIGFLEKSLALTPQSQGAFAVTIAPLTNAWGITTDSPRVVPAEEIEQLSPLVDDSAVMLDGNRVLLTQAGMGLDLGGIAKGEVCSIARDIYVAHGVDSALLWIGGNTYARGTKPDGSAWNIGFRNPLEGGDAYLASFNLTDSTIAISDGSERFFEEDGEVYIHIIDPRTGRPAVSDILSVGVVQEDGATADFWSTTLFVWGLEKSIEHMQNGGTAIVLGYDNDLYVSQSLADSFELYEGTADDYTVTFVAGG